MFRARAAAAFVLALGVLIAVPDRCVALDLPAALGQVATASPTLAARGAMIEAAQRQVAPAGAWSSPILEVGVVNVPTSGRFDEDPMTMKMVGLSQRVPLFGSRRSAGRAAREAVTRERAAAAMAGYDVLGMAWEAYADTRLAGELARTASVHVGLMDRLVESARARFESGNGRLEDLLRSQVERAATQRDLVAFRAEEQAARARLDVLRGADPAGRPDTLAPLPAPVATTAEAWLAAIDPDHPRLLELTALTEGYRFSAQAARRSTWPDLELRASYGFREPLVGLHGTAPQGDLWSATVGLMLPIFAGGRERSEGAAMDAMARVGEAERRRAELELRRDVIAAHGEAAAAIRTTALLADTVITTLHRAVEASWTAYRAGTTDLWRVFEAAHALYSEEVALARTRQTLARAESRLIAMTGRTDLLGVALPATRSEP